MLEDLLDYRNWYDSLPREEQSRYAKALGTKTDYTKEEQIRALSKKYLHKEVRGCGFCLLSAHFELIRLDMTRLTNITSEYALLPGVILHDPVNKDFAKILTPMNMTEDLALYHIANNPKCLELFSRVPADLQKRLQDYLEGKGKTDTMEASRILSIRISGLEKTIETASAALAEAKERVKSLEKEIDENQKTLESLKDMQSAKPNKPSEPTETSEPSKQSRTRSPKKKELDEAKKDKLVKEIKEFMHAGMTKDDIFNAYTTELEAKELSKANVEEAYTEAETAIRGELM